jgi:DNA-binding response OmpR family regulator
MIRLLLVEDDALIGEMVRLNLQQAGYEVTWLKEGQDALDAVASAHYDLVVLDVLLPGLTGFEIARQMRQQGQATPILMLTARSDTASKVSGLDAGADDYLTKPFDVPEFMARVRALLRRSLPEGDEVAPHLVQLGPLQVDLESRQADTNRGRQPLHEDEARLLELFVRRRGQVLSLHEIVEECAADSVTQDASDPLSDADGVRETITRLRELFEPDPDRPRFFTRTRGGYRFES